MRGASRSRGRPSSSPRSCSRRFFPALRLSGLGGLGAEALHEALLRGDLAPQVSGAGAVFLDAPQSLPFERAIVARVLLQPSVSQFGDAGDVSVEERAVVRDDHDRSRVGAQEALEPGDRGQVQVIGGLVQQKQVGACRQQLGQFQSHQPPARELAQGPVPQLPADSQPGQRGSKLCLGFESARVLEGGVQAVVAPEERLRQRCFAAAEAGDLGLGGADLGLQLAQRSQRQGRFFEHRARTQVINLLAQIPPPGVLAQPDPALVGFVELRQEAQQGRLAAAVAAHQADAIPVGDPQRDVLEQGSVAERLAQSTGFEHALSADFPREP